MCGCVCVLVPKMKMESGINVKERGWVWKEEEGGKKK